MVRKTVLVCVAVLGFAAFGPGCSGSASPLGPADDAGADATTEASADAGSTYTLDDVCTRIAPKVCSIRKGCCEKTVGYDEAACITRTKADCEKDVAEVRAGTMTFDPASIDACVVKLAPLIEKCTLTVADFTDAAKLFDGCHTFAGKLGEGIACERDNQCAPSTSAEAFVSCDKSKKVCKTTRILPAGSICDLRDGFDGVCAKGLYCDLDLTKPAPREGVCKTALAIGAECKQSEPLACALGNYCDATNHCAVGKAGEAACTDNLECASINCRKGDAGPGTCKPVDPVVDVKECGK